MKKVRITRPRTSILWKHFSVEINGRDRVRMLVRVRDNFTCQNCKNVRTPRRCKRDNLRHLDVHHLGGLCGKKSHGYDKISEMNRLITLCHKCHFSHPEHSKNTLK